MGKRSTDRDYINELSLIGTRHQTRPEATTTTTSDPVNEAVLLVSGERANAVFSLAAVGKKLVVFVSIYFLHISVDEQKILLDR